MARPRVRKNRIKKIGPVAPPVAEPQRRREDYALVKPPVEVRPIRTGEIDQALGLIFSESRGITPTLSEKIDFFKLMARQENYNLSRQIVAFHADKMVAACLFVPQPGRHASIFTSCPSSSPVVDPPQMSESTIQTLKRGCQWAFRQGSTLLQVLIEPADKKRRHICLQSGFRPLTDLIYMARNQYPLPFDPPETDEMHWLGYHQRHHELFKTVIAQTYQDSLDCPELENLRDMEDVIRSHKAAGRFDPGYWKILLKNNQPQGVLLLTPLRSTDTMELTYMGLCPPARGKRLGQKMLWEALRCASQCGDRCLTLAVDYRNQPALRLYRDFDFKILFRRTVLINSDRWT